MIGLSINQQINPSGSEKISYPFHKTHFWGKKKPHCVLWRLFPIDEQDDRCTECTCGVEAHSSKCYVCYDNSMDDITIIIVCWIMDKRLLMFRCRVAAVWSAIKHLSKTNRVKTKLKQSTVVVAAQIQYLDKSIKSFSTRITKRNLKLDISAGVVFFFKVISRSPLRRRKIQPVRHLLPHQGM